MGFWSDLASAGASAAKNEAAKRQGQSGASAHIQAQNEVTAEFGAILSSYHARQLTNTQAQQAIAAADSGFSAFCQNLGYPRALQGASDVHSLAVKVISDLRTEAGTGLIGSITGALPGVLTGGIGGGLDTTTIALMALAAYMLFKRRL